ncbi:Uncharacterised protein [Vibrio cholerae]|nr:Uncharacterised protein [Vibrio cholerae]CSC81188.1 Uncharacterised protein [Vibrio cholerae]CSI54294.1 Uncharacterised protein [Vibrio cholerae]
MIKSRLLNDKLSFGLGREMPPCTRRTMPLSLKSFISLRMVCTDTSKRSESRALESTP